MILWNPNLNFESSGAVQTLSCKQWASVAQETISVIHETTNFKGSLSMTNRTFEMSSHPACLDEWIRIWRFAIQLFSESSRCRPGISLWLVMWWQNTWIHRRISSFLIVLVQIIEFSELIYKPSMWEYLRFPNFPIFIYFFFWGGGLQFRESSEKFLQSALGGDIFFDFFSKNMKKKITPIALRRKFSELSRNWRPPKKWKLESSENVDIPTYSVCKLTPKTRWSVLKRTKKMKFAYESTSRIIYGATT